MDTLREHDTGRIAFGRHTLLPERGELQAHDSAPVSLGPRATAVLMALIGARGSVISQDYLLKHAWPGQDIHASNLRVQIAALRKALGEDRDLIGTVAGRGYVFAGRLSSASGCAAAFSAAGESARPKVRPLPLPMAEMIGREALLQNALKRLDGCRVLTLAGTGGIGKTSLAMAMAHRVADAADGVRDGMKDGVAWAELADLCAADGVAGAVAGALGMEVDTSHGPNTLAALAECIGQRPLLLVLDNCEHLADAVARLVEMLLQRCPRLRMLATSRQPLLAAGETVLRVPALMVPDETEPEGAHLLQYSAVQLFVTRVRAADGDFHPSPRMAGLIAAICRRLEGLPLAIELAAACVPALGVEQTAAGLGEMLQLLRRGRRTAPARHQTMRAALDWSYALLTDPMRGALRHLAQLPDGFTIDAAVAALAPQGYTAFDAIDALAGLVSHSLALVDHAGTPARYRLPATTRAYALELRGDVELATRTPDAMATV
ncbi:winged helix-turn-helix domain-containing protein [Pseudoduganella sp. LjRoot289]|uniref:ATP-binding protein n=1 Tax=Pseudoduganella sp. LjRoot289 TaxID=3342314 RepID=UPI003ECD3618